MLKIIRRVLRLSGNLSKRIWGSFVCGFLESMFGLLPIVAVFLVLMELQNGQSLTGPTWGKLMSSFLPILKPIWICGKPISALWIGA